MLTDPRRIVPQVGPVLLARHDVAIPRYTSYPAVPDWTGGCDATAWKTHLSSLDGSMAPLALYVHLPFCASRCLYCGCNATVTTRTEVVDRYLDRLEREIGMVAAAIGDPPQVVEMHWGGGTPNFLDEAQLARLVAMLRSAFAIDATTECSVEADPRLVSRWQLEELHQLGFSRISFGVQDLDPAVQDAIGRIQPASLIEEVVAQARGAGFSGINFDLIYGLPRQTAEGFERTVATALALSPDRVACFGYAHVPWLRAHQKRIDAAELPLGDVRFALFRRAVEQFVGAGYEWIGLDHFAKPDDPLARAAESGRLHRNFMGYTTRIGQHLLGLGTSAISEVNGWYVQSAPELGEWQRTIDAGTLSVARAHMMSDEDVLRGAAIAQLMCNAELPYALWSGGRRELEERFEPYAIDGMVRFDHDRVRVTPLGRFFVRNLCAALDAYRCSADGPSRFSRAV
jgi:oxygen-independent coproporphyrinogen-3 oxidase